tara:strand:+ start:1433 stop:1633 length:201 start_codon:yes stop_codon:yes gene_type:complete
MRFAFEVIFVKIYIVSRSLLLLFEREKKLVVEQDGGEIFSQYERTEGPDKKKKDYATLFLRYSFSE